MIKEFLQGQWLKHPIHPALVHIPVSLWLASVVFDLLSFTGNESEVMRQLSVYAIAFGLLTVLLAIPAGIADWLDIKKDKPAWKIGLYHLVMNLTATIAFGLSLAVRLLQEPSSGVGVLPLILSLVGAAFLLVGAYLGGRMTYAYGISVARNSKEHWRKLAEEGKARVPAE